MLNHTSQQEAALEVHQFSPLVAVGCWKDFVFFLCSVYAPICTVLNTPVPPCRSLCDNAKDRCELLMTSYGFAWPESLSCDRFPKLGDAICVSKNITSKATSQPPTTKKGECYTYLLKISRNCYIVIRIIISSHSHERKVFLRFNLFLVQSLE